MVITGGGRQRPSLSVDNLPVKKLVTGLGLPLLFMLPKINFLESRPLLLRKIHFHYWWLKLFHSLVDYIMLFCQYDWHGGFPNDPNVCLP